MAKKVFGGKSKSVTRHPTWMKVLVVVLSLILLLEGLYCVAVFSDIPQIKHLRTMYIETAMSTMSHHWLATYFIPGDIVDAVVRQMGEARESQMGHNSSWEAAAPTTEPTEAPVTEPPETEAPTETEPDPVALEQEAFFAAYPELDQDSVVKYVESHPEAIENGWEALYINEAGLDDDGTSITTTQGDEVLAIDTENQIILVRVRGSTFRGVLAICKDASRLKLGVSSSIGSYGQHVGGIAQDNNGVLAITASGFDDPEGHGTGGTVAGACMASGRTYGKHYAWGYKRIELHEDNRLYLRDAHTGFGDECTDAMEFSPALVIDGENVSSGTVFTSLNPRTCLGQTVSEDILMLVIEGRFTNSLGADAESCADILMRYNCYQAMNLDGGTSAIMWYNGEYVTRCSNTSSPEGRYVPNAWVYCADSVD